MAEAVVEERSAAPVRYFCHKCKVEINIPNADFTCPLCAGGFVEELPSARSEMSGSGNAPTNSASGNRRNSEWNSLRDDLTNLIMSRNASNFEISFGNDGSRRISITGDGNEDRSGAQRGQRRANLGVGTFRTTNDLDRLDNVLLDFLQTLTLNESGGPFGNSQFIFMGNPGDYAWGREGIDTIVTQLLNQMDTTGPPPLDKEKIDEIPIVKVNAEDLKNKLQCSVCWEDFKMDESVRRLPCAHIYHEACIIPWLNLHNTCPICRKSLADENETETGRVPDQRAHNTAATTRPVSIPFLASLQSVMQQQQQRNQQRQQQQQQQQQQSANNRNQASSSGSGNNATTSQENVFTFENSNHDLDMDLD